MDMDNDRDRDRVKGERQHCANTVRLRFIIPWSVHYANILLFKTETDSQALCRSNERDIKGLQKKTPQVSNGLRSRPFFSLGRPEMTFFFLWTAAEPELSVDGRAAERAKI